MQKPSPAAAQFSNSRAEDVKNWCWCTKAQRMGRKDRNDLNILNLFLSVTLCWDMDLSFLIFAHCNYFYITFCSPHSNHCLKPRLIQMKTTTSKLKSGVSAQLLQCWEPMIFFPCHATNKVITSEVPSSNSLGICELLAATKNTERAENTDQLSVLKNKLQRSDFNA